MTTRGIIVTYHCAFRLQPQQDHLEGLTRFVLGALLYRCVIMHDLSLDLWQRLLYSDCVCTHCNWCLFFLNQFMSLVTGIRLTVS